MCIFFSSPRSFFILRSILIDLHRPSSPSLFFFSNRFVREFHFDLREFTLRYPSKNFCRKYISSRLSSHRNELPMLKGPTRTFFETSDLFPNWHSSSIRHFMAGRNPYENNSIHANICCSFDLSASIIRLRIIVLRISRFSRIHLGLASFFSRSGGGAHQMPRVSISSKSSQ